MATSNTSSVPPTPHDNRNYANPGVFAGTWPNIFVIEESNEGIVVPTTNIPWDILASIKMTNPEIGRGIVICGWEGVRETLMQLERVMLLGITR